MRIEKVRVSGFRGIVDLEISLEEVTVLLGVNNAGKTSLLKALELALGDYGRYVSEEDFHLSAHGPCEQITVDVLFLPEEGNEFSEMWVDLLVDGSINLSMEGEKESLVLRTVVKPNTLRDGHKTERGYLAQWAPLPEKHWTELPVNKKQLGKMPGVSFIPMNAQRDIQKELTDRHSYVGKVLAGVEYSPTDTEALEQLMQEVNSTAVERSEALRDLKGTLGSLSKSFGGRGAAEINPLPKHLRDLTKKFNVQFGEEGSSFSMEYHGMGTRSWASLLTGKAFIEYAQKRAQGEEELFYPIIAIEEPEAHLHPNAQRVLYQQLKDIPGQVLVSTHSPYISGQARLEELRYLQRDNEGVQITKLRQNWDGDDRRKLEREIIHSRGELLFSRALVLGEGETEEQALPRLLLHYLGTDSYTMGVNFIGVGGNGARYTPFLQFAKDLKIPVFIFSDGEERVIKGKKGLTYKYDQVYGAGSYESQLDQSIFILDGMNFEQFLLNSGYEDMIISVIEDVESSRRFEQFTKALEEKPDQTHDLIKNILDKSKPRYADAIASALCELEKEQLPAKVVSLFNKLQTALS